MNATIKSIEFSADDGKWSRQADFKDLKDFFENPQAWVKGQWANLGLNGGLTDIYTVRIARNPQFEDEVSLRIGGSSHIVGDARISSLVDITVNPPAIAAHFASMDLATIWDDVRAAFTSPRDMTITYTKSADTTRGPVNVHMELPPDTAKMGTLIAAIVAVPSGLQAWMEEQNIAKERWVLANQSFQDIVRPSGQNPNDHVTFRSSGTIIITAYAYLALNMPATSACNADDGHYMGDPTLVDTNIDIDDMEFKLY